LFYVIKITFKMGKLSNVTESSFAAFPYLSLLTMKSHFDRLAQAIQTHLPKYLNASGRGAIGLAGTIGLLGAVVFPASAQIQAITQINASYGPDEAVTTVNTTTFPQTSGGATTTAAVNYGVGTNNNLNITSIQTASSSITFRGLSNALIIRRKTTLALPSERHIIFAQGSNNSTTVTNNTYNIAPTNVTRMEDALLNQTLNRGADNLFANTGGVHINNIERLDYIITSGLTARNAPESQQIGFIVMDRGTNDTYVIAPILDIDALGNPTEFGDPEKYTMPSAAIVSIGNAAATAYSLNYHILARESSPTDMRPSQTGSQSIGGHFIPLSTFKKDNVALPFNTTIYGYALFPGDVPITRTQATRTSLLDVFSFSSSTPFNGDGGLDLMAGGGVFSVNPLPPVGVSVSGNVFDDGNGTKLKDGNGTAEDYTSADITAVLLDGNDKVIQTASIDGLGNYNFKNVFSGNYTVKIIKTPATPLVNNVTIPATSDILPSNWIVTGENKGGTTAGIDPVADRMNSVSVATTNVTGINFGIEQLPTAKTTTTPSQENPGSTTSVAVPPTLFNTSTDPDGTVAKYRITAFPTNATSFTITQGGVTTTYTSTTFPSTGLTILPTELSTLTVDPSINGAGDVTIPFKAIDNAGKESTNGTNGVVNAVLPFTAAANVSVSGTVFNDVNGNQLQGGTEPIVNGTTLALNAVLFDVTGNKVYAVTSVSATGTYSFGNVAPGDYTVILTTAPASVSGSIPDVTLPNNWATTGENLSGTVETTPAIPDSKIAITVAAANITNLNFGIEELPTAIGASDTLRPNPGGTTSVPVSPTVFASSDLTGGTVDKYRITAFPTNATSFTITQAGVTTTYTTANFPAAGLTILKTELSTLTIDPNFNGTGDVTIPFKAIDNAGKESINGTNGNDFVNAIVPFTVGNTPELTLLKRITKVNGLTTAKTISGAPIDLTAVVAQPDNPATIRNESGDASNPNWPTANYPKGAIDAGAIKSGDTIEYTIYFLSVGSGPVKNANFCDWVPKNTTFVPDAYGLGRGIQLAIGSILNTFTNVPDYNPNASAPFLASNDRGMFLSPGAAPPTNYPDNTTYKLNCMNPMGVDGAVVVNLVNNTLAAPENQLPNATSAGTPGNSYGFVRFVSKVK
jgi:SdrD B-like domain